VTKTEENTSLEDIHSTPSSEGGELLNYAEEISNQPEDVSVEVENTTVAVIRGLLGSLTPAHEIDKLMKMREPANDNNEELKEAA